LRLVAKQLTIGISLSFAFLGLSSMDDEAEDEPSSSDDEETEDEEEK